jgi:hypothetical protein
MDGDARNSDAPEPKTAEDSDDEHRDKKNSARSQAVSLLNLRVFESLFFPAAVREVSQTVSFASSRTVWPSNTFHWLPVARYPPYRDTPEVILPDDCPDASKTTKLWEWRALVRL